MPVTIRGKLGSGFTFALGDTFAITLRGRFMLRYSLLAHDEQRSHDLAVRRARLYMQGHVLRRDLQYMLHVAFANQDYDPISTNLIYDAYVQWVRWRDLKIRVGQQLVPFNRARVISSQNAELVDRSIVNAELNLDRDIGVKLFSNDLFGWGGRLGYELFVGTGEGRNQLGADMGLLYVGRLQLNPMGAFDDMIEGDLERHAWPKLSLAGNLAFNHSAVRQRSTTGTRYTLGSFDYLHAAVDLLFKWRGLSVMAEWLYRQADHDSNQGIEAGHDKTEYSRSGMGYFVQLGYVTPWKIGISGRYSQELAAAGTDPSLITQVSQTGRELIGALSYYLAGHVLKLQADYAYLYGDDLAAGRHQFRLQAHVGY